MVKIFYNTANCVKSVQLSVVVSFRILIPNFEGATSLGHVVDDVSSLYKWNFLPAKQVIFYTFGKQILCWLIFAEEPYLENQWFLRYSPSNFIWWLHTSHGEFGISDILFAINHCKDNLILQKYTFKMKDLKDIDLQMWCTQVKWSVFIDL